MKMNASEKAGLAACGVTIISLAIASYKLQKERDKALKQRDHYKEMYEMASTQDSRKSRILDEISLRWWTRDADSLKALYDIFNGMENRFWYGRITEEVMNEILGDHPLTTERE